MERCCGSIALSLLKEQTLGGQAHYQYQKSTIIKQSESTLEMITFYDDLLI